MKYVLAAILLLASTGLILAADTNDYRISDGDGHVLDIATDGSIYISTTSGSIVNTAGAHDIRVSDEDGDVLDINSDGTVNVSTN